MRESVTTDADGVIPVSYTHLDVYKRQADMYAWVKGVDVEDVLEPDGSFFMTEEMGKEIERFAGGENIAAGLSLDNNPVEQGMVGFMNSEGHRYAILDGDYTRVGVGFAVSDYGTIYCCQKFA